MGDHVRKRRMDLELLQREVADRIGCSKAALLMWEKGRSYPEIRLWPAILEFLGYDPSPPPLGTADRLKVARRRLGYSQKQLAQRMDVDPTTVADWERGRRPRFHRCKRVLQDLFEELSL